MSLVMWRCRYCGTRIKKVRTGETTVQWVDIRSGSAGCGTPDNIGGNHMRTPVTVGSWIGVIVVGFFVVLFVVDGLVMCG